MIVQWCECKNKNCRHISEGYEEIISCPFEAFSNASFAFSLSFLNLYATAFKEKWISLMCSRMNKFLSRKQGWQRKSQTSLLIQGSSAFPISIPPCKTQFCSAKNSIFKRNLREHALQRVKFEKFRGFQAIKLYWYAFIHVCKDFKS